MISKLDNATAYGPAQTALATSLSGCSDNICPNVRAIYFFILKAFFITGLLGWLFIACPAVVADEFTSLDVVTPNIDKPYSINLLNSGWQITGSAQYDASWLQQNAGDYKSVDGLHAGVKRLRQILSTWWESNPNQSSVTSRVQNLIAATGEGPYAAWSYNIGASSKSLEVSIRYEF